MKLKLIIKLMLATVLLSAQFVPTSARQQPDTPPEQTTQPTVIVAGSDGAMGFLRITAPVCSAHDIQIHHVQEYRRII